MNNYLPADQAQCWDIVHASEQPWTSLTTINANRGQNASEYIPWWVTPHLTEETETLSWPP